MQQQERDETSIYQDVAVDVADGIMTITIDRPAAKNALDGRASEAISAALIRFDADAECRVAIITGANGTFCAGMDLKARLRGDRVMLEGRGFAGLTETPPVKPLIAAVEGFAVGGGFEIALAADLIVASDQARFALPEVKRGLIAGAGGLLRLSRQLPARIAMELALTGGMLDAARAAEFGLVNRVVPAGTALEEARGIARMILENAPLAVAASKRIIVESRDWSTGEMFARQRAIMEPVSRSEDAREGSLAFAEKRKPVWRGC